MKGTAALTGRVMESMGSRVPLPHLLLRASRGRGDVKEKVKIPRDEIPISGKVGAQETWFC